MNTTPEENVIVVDRSETKAPSCRLQLTDWLPTRQEIQFAMDQLDKYSGPWMLKRNTTRGLFAVFVPGSKQDGELIPE